VLAYLRKKGEDEVIVFLNLSDHAVRFDLLERWVQGKFKEVFLNKENDFGVNKSFEMKGWEWRVWVK
jgi:alpha-amylase